MERRKVLAITLVLLAIVSYWVVLAYDSTQRQVYRIEVKLIDYDLLSSKFVIKIYNPTPYTYTIEDLSAKYYSNNIEVFSGKLDKPVVVGPGEAVNAELDVSYNVKGIILHILVGEGQGDVVTYMKGSASLGPIPLGSFELHNFTIESSG